MLHFEDDRGGYANVRCDGHNFVLIESHSAGRSASAKQTDTRFMSSSKMGDLLLLLTPMLAWLLITWFVRRNSDASGAQSTAMALAAPLQIGGMIVLSFALLAAPQTMDEVSGGLMALFVLIAAVCSLAGLSILAWGVMRVDLEAQKA